MPSDMQAKLILGQEETLRSSPRQDIKPFGACCPKRNRAKYSTDPFGCQMTVIARRNDEAIFRSAKARPFLVKTV